MQPVCGKTSPKTGPKLETGWIPGPQATILGVLLRPVVRVFRLWCMFVGQFGPKSGPQTAPNGARRRRWGPVGAGGCVLGWNLLWQRVGSLLLVFCPFLPRQRCVVSFGSKTASKRPQTGPVGPGTCTTGVRWPYLGTHSTWARCGLPFVHILPVFLL